MEAQGIIELSVVDCDEQGQIDIDHLKQSIRENTRLIAMTHASNVLGHLQPLQKIGELADSCDALFLVDCAQTLGQHELDVRQLRIDLLAAPGHKGLLGPLGTGILYVERSLADSLQPLIFGGTGSESESDRQPAALPGKFESGNLNTAALAGLLAGIRYLATPDGEARLAQMRQKREYVFQALATAEGITIYGGTDSENRVDLLSFNIDGMECHEATAILEANFGIECRAGLHCAPLVHRHLQTENSGGAIRLSWGLFNSEEDLKKTVEAIIEVASVNIF